MKHLVICKLGDMHGDAVISRFTYCNLEETHLVWFAISGYRCLSLCRVFDFGTQAASPIRRSDPWNWSRLDTKWLTSASVHDFFFQFLGTNTYSCCLCTMLLARNPHIEVTNFTADFQEIDVFGRMLKAFKWWSGFSMPNSKIQIVALSKSSGVFYPFVWFSFLATFSHLSAFHKFLQ